MKIDRRISRDIIDRRFARTTIVAGLLALVATLFGRSSSRVDPEIDLVHATSTALDRGQEYWSRRVPGYRRARVVLFRGSTRTPCGRGRASAGPFYCPEDERIYLDLSFLAAIGTDFARAYVIGHELGHHVQHQRNELAGRASVDVELGADCYAGAWARSEQAAGRLEVGDVSAALAAAAAIGDDRLCPSCAPEQWTHGSADQRVGAVTAGLGGALCSL